MKDSYLFFALRSIIIISLIILTSIPISAQFDYDDEIVVNTPLPKTDTCVIDEFNNIWDPANDPSNSTNTLICSGFTLIFSDEVNGNLIGFNDPILGPIRQQTACEVFNYLASIIDLGAANPIIVFQESDTNGQGSLGQAILLYDNLITSGFVGGFLRDHIFNGIDPDTTVADAAIKIDFGDRYIGNITITINSDFTQSSGGQLDLFSIILHEAMHTLGFATLISANGTSTQTWTLNGPYTFYDKFLFNNYTLTNTFVDINAIFDPALVGDLTEKDVWYDEVGNTIEQPVYSPVSFISGRSLSHFDEFRSNTHYVMRSSTSGGDDRLLTLPEIEVLCNLGYTILVPDACTNNYPIGIEDFGPNTTPGQQVCFDVLSNDTDAEGDPISFDLSCGGGTGIVIVNGGGSAFIDFSTTPPQVCYTPSSNFTGTAHLLYCPTDGFHLSNLVNNSNITDIFVTVESTFCPEDPCNLVCNGTFEGGANPCDPLTPFGYYTTMVACPSYCDNWCPSTGTPDYMVRSSCAPGSNKIPFGSIDTRTGSNSGNDRFMNNKRWSDPSVEGVYTHLITPLDISKNYILTFYANTMHHLSGPTAQLIIGLNDIEPTVSGNQQTTIINQQLGIVNVPLYTWTLISINFTPIQTSLEYLIIEAKSTTAYNSGANILIDDVRLLEVDTLPNLQFNKTVAGIDSIFILGDTITYSIEICNTDTINDAIDVVLEEFLSPYLTYISGFDSFPFHTIDTISAAQCITIELTVLVQDTAPLNTAISNCTYAISGGSNCATFGQFSNCIDIIIPATDVVITKTADTSISVSVGDTITYTIIVTNIGYINMSSATGIIIEDILPSGVVYISHTIIGDSAVYDTSTGLLEIPFLDIDSIITLEVTVVVNDLCSSVENCATLISMNEIDIGLSNNSDCAEISGIITLVADAGPDTTICFGVSIVIGPSIIDTNLSYSWFPTTGLNDPNIPNPFASPIDTTIYILTVIDTITGCTSIDQITVMVVDEWSFDFIAFVYPNGYNISCNGGSDGFISDITIIGGLLPFTLIEISPLPADPPNISAGTYTIILSDANGCFAVDTLTLTEPPGLITASSPTLFCEGDSVILTSNSPTGNQWYLNGNILSGDTNQTLNVDSSGFYTVISPIPDACGILVEVDICTGTPDLCVDIIGSQKPGSYNCETLVGPGCDLCSQIQYTFTYQNLGGTMTFPCTLIVTLPSQVSYVSTIPPIPSPDTVIIGPPTQLIWTDLCDPLFPQNLNGINITITVEIPVNIPTCITVPQTLIALAEFTPLDGGCDNLDLDTLIYNGPFDPNDKMLVSPQGVGVCHTILKTDTLIYQINFQNVGTALAHNVIIVDTLDPAKLDIFTFSLLHTSHPATITLTPQGIFTFIFNNINLPDSAADLTGSVGFVKFSIQPVSNIAPGTVIENKAAIYFDSNDPVITNTVMNTILGEPLQITSSGATTFCLGGSVTLTSSPSNSYLWSTGDTTQSIIVNTSGTFSVADASGCLANSEPVTVTVVAVPTVDAGDDQTVYIGYTPQVCAVLSAVASGGDLPYNYSWGTGETTQEITVCPNITTTYTITVSDINGCSSSDEITVNVVDIRCGNNLNKVLVCHIPPGNPDNPQTICISPNAVPAHLAQHGDYLGQCEDTSFTDSLNFQVQSTAALLKIYPNPSKNSTTIEYYVPEEIKKAEIKVYDMISCTKLKSYNLNKNGYGILIIDASYLSSGMYICWLYINGSPVSIKKLFIIK